MIATILACCYITFICYAWGSAFMKLFSKIEGADREVHFSVISFVGLAAITIIAAMLSLFIPLGSWKVQLIFLLPSFFFLKYTSFRGLSAHKSILVLAVSAVICMLVMSTWWIIHPDTLGYHAQTIKWIEEFKAVPGLVHLHTRLGYQGLWFVSEALFSFKFTGSNAVTYVNVAVLAWFIFFLCARIDNCIKDRDGFRGLLWLSFFAYTLWNYTQVRLTATSASPDFIATMCILLVFYLFIQNAASWLLLICLSVFAVTVKLSTLPVLLFALYCGYKLLRQKTYHQLVFAFVLSLIILIPFVTRNVITSGWMVFPSTFPDVLNADWKYDEAKTAQEKRYITAYARTKSGESASEINDAVNASVTEWMPVWWNNLSLADQTLLVAGLILMFYLLVRVWRPVYEEAERVTCAIAVIGLLFWFTQAPDPRFGAGFLLMFPILALSKLNVKASNKMIIAGAIAIAVGITTYTVYRVMNFFETEQLMRPLGIKQQESSSVNCNGIEIHVPPKDEPCNTASLPCAENGCASFETRGNDVKHGFRSK